MCQLCGERRGGLGPGVGSRGAWGGRAATVPPPGRAHAWPASYLLDATGWAWAWAAGPKAGAASRRCASSLAASAGKAGGEPSSSTFVTVLPIVNQSLIWSRVSLRSMLPAWRRRLLNCPRGAAGTDDVGNATAQRGDGGNAASPRPARAFQSERASAHAAQTSCFRPRPPKPSNENVPEPAPAPPGPRAASPAPLRVGRPVGSACAAVAVPESASLTLWGPRDQPPGGART